ncbi:uncharacterized protein [Nicotiana sylvestris]|uniref:Uncharacterized protein LOC104218223 isoform X2 n=1 Tax=Nicotiana sylvestris TaxID=4096 RepID=A0A1U7VX49_NICSY|nr:PREDICTED: uncharacterized protein LOC104218223 isoform X2 [Nicotiana sylvestris]
MVSSLMLSNLPAELIVSVLQQTSFMFSLSLGDSAVQFNAISKIEDTQCNFFLKSISSGSNKVASIISSGVAATFIRYGIISPKIGALTRANEASIPRPLFRVRAVQDNGGGPWRLVDIIRVVPEISRNYFKSPSRRALFGECTALFEKLKEPAFDGCVSLTLWNFASLGI